MPAPTAPDSTFSDLWTYAVPFVSALLAAGVGIVMARLSRSATETSAFRKAADDERKAWRAGRLAAEKAQHEAHTELNQKLVLFELNYKGDMERVANLFSRFVTVSEQHTTMTEQMRWHRDTMNRHDKEFEAVHDELKSLQNDIKHLFRNAPPTA